MNQTPSSSACLLEIVKIRLNKVVNGTIDSFTYTMTIELWRKNGCFAPETYNLYWLIYDKSKIATYVTLFLYKNASVQEHGLNRSSQHRVCIKHRYLYHSRFGTDEAVQSMWSHTMDGMCAKNTIYSMCMLCQQALIEWAQHVNFIVACCHSVKLYALVAQALQLQQVYSQNKKNSYNSAILKPKLWLFGLSQTLGCRDNHLFTHIDCKKHCIKSYKMSISKHIENIPLEHKPTPTGHQKHIYQELPRPVQLMFSMLHHEQFLQVARTAQEAC